MKGFGYILGSESALPDHASNMGYERFGSCIFVFCSGVYSNFTYWDKRGQVKGEGNELKGII